MGVQEGWIGLVGLFERVPPFAGGWDPVGPSERVGPGGTPLIVESRKAGWMGWREVG